MFLFKDTNAYLAKDGHIFRESFGYCPGYLFRGKTLYINMAIVRNIYISVFISFHLVSSKRFA